MAIIKEYRVTSTTKWSDLGDSDLPWQNDIARAKPIRWSSISAVVEDEYNKFVTLTFADSAALADWRNDYPPDTTGWEDFAKPGFTLNISGPSGKLDLILGD